MPPKLKEDRVQIKQFKEGSSDFWCGMAHYHLNEVGELIWCSGEVDKEELRTSLLAYLRRNKKVYKAREKSIIETEERVWSTLEWGKYNGKKLDEVKDIEPKYLRWVYENSADKKLTQEIKELLKIK